MITNLIQQFSANLFSIDSSWFATTFQNGDPNPAYLFWGYVRGAANILLIIVLLVIIFSQLTGLFIDNYGIKKMLPKLIVSVLLINLSFFICSVAVDLSNLFGYGILGWLNSINDDIKSTVTVSPGSVFATILDVMVGAGAGALAAISSLGVSITAVSGPVLVIGLLIALLIALLAIAFVFLLLGAREIMCMVLVAISPLAFFCLILPNTQKLFSKWMNMMKGLLMIYPIIATMYGGAKIVRNIIIGNAPNYNGSGVTAFLMLMIGAALPFVPFFLIPLILKKALGAVAGGFEKLKAMGNKGINSAQRGFQNSKWAQQQNDKMWQQRRDKALAKRDALNAKGKHAAAERQGIKAGKYQGLHSSYMDKKAGGAAMTKASAEGADASKMTGAQNAASDEEEWNNLTQSEVDLGEDGTLKWDKNKGWLKDGKAISDEDKLKLLNKYLPENAKNKVKTNDGEFTRNSEGKYMKDGREATAEEMKGINNELINKMLSGEARKNVHTRDGDFTLNEQTGKYEKDGVEASTEEMKAINQELAKIPMRQNYTKGKDGKYRNSFGQAVSEEKQRQLEEDERNGGFVQSYADFQRARAAEARAKTRGDLVGGYAGQDSLKISHAAELGAENSAMSRTASTLGAASSIDTLRGVGINTTTSQLSAQQSTADQLLKVAGANVGAAQRQIKAGIPAQVSEAFEATVEVPLSLKEKAKLVNAAKAGNLDNIIRSADSSEKMKQIAREMKASGQDFTSFGAGTETSANISKFIDNAEASLRKETGIVTTSEKEQLVAAAKNGTLSSIATSTLASAGQIALAKQMLSSGKDYSSFGSSAEGSKAIKSEIDALEQVALSGGASLDTAQKERLTVSAKNGSLEADFINNPNASVLEKYAAQRILDNSSRIGEAGHGSQFIKQNIDSTLESISNNMGGIASIGAVMSANDTTETRTRMVQPPAEEVLDIGRTSNQVTDTISAEATRVSNQFTTQSSNDKAGEVEANRDVAERQAQNEYNLKTAKNDINITPNISLDYAKKLEKQRFDISQEKMYDEELKLKPKGELLSTLSSISSKPDQDTNYVRSLLKGIMQKGGDDDIQTFALNRTRTDNVEVERVYDEFYAASTEPTLKAYGKFVSDVKNNVADVDLLSIPTFKQWCEGSEFYELKKHDGTSATYDGTKFTDLKGYVDNLGNEALQNASRGYIKVMSQNEEISGKYSDRSILYGMVHNRDNEAQAELRTVISGWGDERRIKAMQTLSDNEIATMTLTDWNAVFGGDITKMKISDFASKGADLEKFEKIYNDSRLSRFMPSEVKEFIHRSMPSSAPSPITDATEIDHSKDDTYTSDMGM